MDDRLYGLIELLLVFGVILGWAGWQWWDWRRWKRAQSQQADRETASELDGLRAQVRASDPLGGRDGRDGRDGPGLHQEPASREPRDPG